jgi:hypothetical protein
MPVKLSSTGGGDVTLAAPNTGSSYTITLPAATANLVTTSDSGVVTTGMIASGAITRSLLPAGSVLQVVQTVVTAASSYSGSTYQDISGMSVSITPTKSSSKILVIVDLKIGSSGNQFQNTILRNGSQIYVGDASGSRGQSSSAYYYADGNIMVSCPSTYLDSPATTSLLTYKLQGRTDAGAAWYLNRTPSDANSITGTRTASSITVMEISA